MRSANPRVPVARETSMRVAICLVIALVDAGALLAKLPSWYGSLPATLGSAQLLDVFAAPLSGGLGAWIGSRRRASSMVEWARSTGVTQGRLVRSEVGYVLLPICWAHVVVMVLATGASAARNADFIGPAMWMTHVVVELVASCTFWCCLGWLAAQVIEPLKSVCLAVVLPFVAATAVFFLFPFSWPADLLVSAGNTFLTTVPAFVPGLAKLAFWVALAGLAWSLCALRSRWWGPAALAAMLSCVLFAAFASEQSPIPGADDAACDGDSGLVVCAPRAYRAVLPSQLDESRKAVAGLPAGVAPTRIVAPELIVRGEVVPRGTVEMAALSGSYSPSLVLSASEYTASLGDAIVTQACQRAARKPHDPAPSFDTDAAVWRLWWRLSRGLPTEGSLYVGDADPAKRSDYPQVLHQAQAIGSAEQKNQAARLGALWAKMQAACA